MIFSIAEIFQSSICSSGSLQHLNILLDKIVGNGNISNNKARMLSNIINALEKVEDWFLEYSAKTIYKVLHSNKLLVLN